MKTMPVIFVHLGNIPTYLIRAMEQAYLYNRNIILLTDSGFKHKNVISRSIDDLKEGIDSFDKVYKHMSTNGVDFERTCIIRWFILKNFLNKKRIDTCFYADSDVMIYDDLSSVYEYYKEYDASYALAEAQDNYRWAASACCSYWTLPALNGFTDFILESYSPGKIGTLLEKWDWHKRTNAAGGICDMTLLYLFSKAIKFCSLTKVKDGFTFDHNMRIAENYYPNEYEMEIAQGMAIPGKRITWKNGQPYGHNLVMNKEIRFVALTEYAKLLEEVSPAKMGSIGRIKSAVKKLINR